MNIVLELKKGGRFRRHLENIFREEGWWVHSVHPKSFERSVRGILNLPENLDVQYEFALGEYAFMQDNLKEDRSGVCLILVDISEDSMKSLKEDVGAFSFRDFGDKSPRQVFEAMVKPIDELEEVISE